MPKLDRLLQANIIKNVNGNKASVYQIFKWYIEISYLLLEFEICVKMEMMS